MPEMRTDFPINPSFPREAWERGARGALALLQELMQQLHVIAAAYQERRSFVQAGRHLLKDALPAIGGDALGLLRQERNRIAFIEQTQLAGGMRGGRRIQKDAALEQRAMEVRNE